MLISLMLAPAGEHRWGANYVRQQVIQWEHFRRGNAAFIQIVARQLRSGKVSDAEFAAIASIQIALRRLARF
jgi:hypothetical protein